jgi:CBS domain containing-hemolysin-like protein
MWSRVIEFMLACWLAASPFIFRHGEDATVLWISDFACASAIALFALISYWQPARHAHLLIIPVALWMIGFGRFGEAAPLSAGLQNNIAVGLTLLMFAIIPNHAFQPPQVWFKEAPWTKP